MGAAGDWLRARAKVNLQLSVLGRRQDGFHELDGIMAHIELADAVACAELDDAAGSDRLERVAHGPAAPGAGAVAESSPLTGTGVPNRHTGEGAPSGLERDDSWLDRHHLSLDADNLVLRAASAYRAAAGERGVRVPPLHWRLVKRIPIAAGLGGGSSDAAAALRLLGERYPAGVDLLELGAQLGSDVPFFVLGAAAARARGRGERLEPVSVPPQPLVLVNPGVGVSAGDAFRWWRPMEVRPRSWEVRPRSWDSPLHSTESRPRPTESRPPRAEARVRPASAAPSAAPDWWAGPPVANDLEAGVAAHVSEVRSLLAALRSAWDGPVAMSGSGATCFAVTPDARAAEALAARLRQRLGPEAWIAVSSLSPGPDL